MDYKKIIIPFLVVFLMTTNFVAISAQEDANHEAEMIEEENNDERTEQEDLESISSENNDNTILIPKEEMLQTNENINNEELNKTETSKKEVEKGNIGSNKQRIEEKDISQRFDESDWTIDKSIEGVWTITGFKNPIENVYIPSYVYKNGQDVEINIKNLKSLVNDNQKSFVIEAVGKHDDPDNLRKVHVDTMREAFRGRKNIKTIDLSGLDTSDVDSFYYLFLDAENLGSLNMNGFDTRNVKSLVRSFMNTKNLQEINVKDWDTSKVTNIQYAFYNSGVKNIDVSEWDVSNVEDMTRTFANTSMNVLDVSNWDVSKTQYMYGLFNNSRNIKELDVSKWNVSKVSDFEILFSGVNVHELNVSNWDTQSAIDMKGMFNNAINVETLDLNNWDVSKVKDLSDMFQGTKNLKTLNISNWNVSNAESISRLFENSGIINLNLNSWNTENLTYMMGTFSKMPNLTNLKIDQWNVANVKNMDSLFSQSPKIESLSLNNWDVTSLENASKMFFNMESLQNLEISNWNLPKLKNTYAMFANNNDLNYLNLSNWKLPDTVILSSLFSTWDLSYAKLTVIASDPKLLSYNFESDRRIANTPTIDAKSGNFEDSTTKKVLNDKIVFENYSDALISANRYNEFMNKIPTSNSQNLVFLHWSPNFTNKTEETKIWEDNTIYGAEYGSGFYTVSFVIEENKNDIEVKYDTLVTEKNIPETLKEGYTFKEWNIKADGTGTTFDPTTDTVKEDLTVYAIFNINEYTVTFDVEGTTTETLVDYEHKVIDTEIPETSKGGYTFKEWNTKADGTGTTFDPTTDTVKEDLTVYAIFNINEYTVTFDVEGTTTEILVDYDHKVVGTEILNTLKEGYTFKEWNTKADGTGTAFDPATDTVKEDLTVYAIFNINEYTVTFDVEGTTTEILVDYDHKVIDTEIPETSKEGYSFKEWNTKADGTGTTFDPTTDTVKEDVTVYAIYDINEYTVKFDVEGTTTETLVDYDHKVIDTEIPETSKEGYTFKEWNTKADGTGTTFNPTTDTVKEDLTVYAIYDEIPMNSENITPNVNNGEKEEENMIVPQTSVTNHYMAHLIMMLIAGLCIRIQKRKKKFCS